MVVVSQHIKVLLCFLQIYELCYKCSYNIVGGVPLQSISRVLQIRIIYTYVRLVEGNVTLLKN